ncbi:ATP-binding protein [Streptomyces sp. PTD5-9]|uniref:ATP-binding protein n=1 Tax=Streptomyces sp. PTD5-9 TaxID=3120150 RepID=UPI003008E07A
MDPTHQGPEEYGRDENGSGGGADGRRPSPEPSPGSRTRSGRGGAAAPDFGQPAPHPARVVRLISGDYLLTVNPVDGSEVELCPPGEHPEPPVRRTATERAARERAAAPPVPPGPPAPQPPLLERSEERERLVRLLARGRSVRLTGPAGSGRTTLLNAVAADCADFAPDGVVRLSGHKRSVTDVLYALFEAVYEAAPHRPEHAGLLDLLRGVGAVVLLDDLEFGGAALEELLDATPECAFLLTATPDVAAPAPDSDLEEVFLPGLGRGSSVELLERLVERPLTEEEKNWAGDLWFESEGLPLRFVQAGALLCRRDLLRADPGARDLSGAPAAADRPAEPPFGHDEATDGVHIPLPGLGEAAAPAPLLASGLSEPARDTLRFAVALGGEVPHQAHLPALVGDTHADAALGELAACGLLSPAGSRYRLAAGAVAQLEAAGYGADSAEHARTAAQHYAWWAGHPSVTPGRVTAEADAVVAALARLVPGEEAGQTSAAVLLARSAAPAFAAGLHWGAWEKTLRIGQEAARIAGEVAEEAYFHHELGILALCSGSPDRARTELETSIGMRGALADKPGMVVGRRALALVADRSGGPLPGGPLPGGPTPGGPVPGGPVPGGPVAGGPAAVGRTTPTPRFDETTPLPLGPAAAAARKRAPGSATDTTAVIPSRAGAAPAPGAGAAKGRIALLGKARRNLVAIGAGALLAAVLGTVVVLGATSGDGTPRGNPGVTSEESPGDDANGATDDGPADGSGQQDRAPDDGPVTAGPSEGEPTPSGSGTPTGSAEPSDRPSPGAPSDDHPAPDGTTDPATPTKPSTPTASGEPSPSPTDDTSTEPTPQPSETQPVPPDTTDSAGGPASSSLSASAEAEDGAPEVV